MRIAIVAPGSRGDVQPFVALGKGLKEAGHAVRLVTHEGFRVLVTSHRLGFWPVDGRVEDVASSPQMRRLLEGGNFYAVMSQMAREAERGAVSLAEAGLAACRGTDLLIAGLAGLFVGLALAEKLNLCCVQAHYIPFTPTREYPSFVAPRLPSWLGGALNGLSHHAVRQMIWQSFRAADRVVGTRVLDLPPAPFWGPYRADRVRHGTILYGYSASAIASPSDWAANTHVTGYWFVDPADGCAPPQALTEFLQAGSPPVYVGFGSMSSRRPGETADLVLQALARAGRRAVMLTGWGGLQKRDLPDSVFALDSIPFSLLFPRVAAVVHHGGAGTTAEGLRAGVPTVVIPFLGDRPYWGWRVAELGVGPPPIPRRKLTVDQLAHAIHSATTDDPMRRRAAALGATIRAEDGVARAVDVVRQIVERGPAAAERN